MCRRMKSFLFTATGIFEKGGNDDLGYWSPNSKNDIWFLLSDMCSLMHCAVSVSFCLVFESMLFIESNLKV